MPYKYETKKSKIPKEYDRRFRLTDEQRNQIRAKYQRGVYGYQKLGKEYGVSKRTVFFVINTDAYERNKNISKKRARGGTYYDKNKHRLSMRAYRKYKKELNRQGILL